MGNIFERDYPADIAYSKVHTVFESLNLSVIVKTCDEALLSSYIIVIGDDHVEASGSGKGKFHKLGALAECIEHYLSATALADVNTYKNTYEIASQPSLVRDGVIQSL